MLTASTPTIKLIKRMEQGCSTKLGRIITSAMWLVATVGAVISSSTNLKADCTPPPAGLVAWWPGEGNANDTAGTNNGTLLNGDGFINGEVGQSFLFGTTNAGMKVPASLALDVGQGNGFTVEGWIKPATLATRGEIAEWNNGDTNQSVPYGVHLQILAPGELGLGAGNLFADVHSADGQTHWIMAPGGTITTNAFQHVALTYNKGTGVATIYCNGAIVAQQTLGSFTPLTSYDFYIGRRPAGIGSVHSFLGSIDELSLYNRALVTNEIVAIYAAGSAGKCVSMSGSITAYIVPSGTIGNQTLPVSQTQSMGNDFDVVSPITISSLGVFDSGGDGLVGTLIARIYNRDTQVSIASLIFTSSDSGMLAGGSRFKDLPTPITLPTGFHGVCSVAYLGTTSLEPDGNLRVGSGNWTTNNGGGLLSFVGMGRHSLMGTGDSFPNIVESAPAPNNFAAGTFNYSATTGTAPSIVVAPQSQTNDIGDNITFNVTANGTMPFSYQWSRNTINIPGATNATLLLNNIHIVDAGNYSVVVSNSYGSATSSNAALTIMIPDCTTPPSGLVGWWQVNGNLEDGVNTNRGILGGGVFFGAGKVAGGLVCATNSTGVRIPANAALNVGLGNGLTIECWINPIDLKLGPIVEWNNGAGAMGVHFWKGEFAGPGTLYANLVDTNGNNHVMQSVGGVVQSNVWQHVALSYDHATGIASMYCNGVLVKQQNIGVLTLRTSYDFYLGNRPEPTADATSFVGSLDEVSLYNRALSTNEIAAIYAAGSAGKCAPEVTNGIPILIDVDFGGGGIRPSDETGPAAIGLSDSDFWNFYTRDDTNGNWLTFGSLPHLKLVDGTVTDIGLTVDNAPGDWGNGSTDPMFNDFVYPFNGGDVTITVTNLSAGSYDLYAYSANSSYEVTAGGINYGVKSTYEPVATNPPVWIEGVSYARFTNIVITAGQPLVLTALPLHDVANISGLQIISSPATIQPPTTCTPPPTGLVAWWTAENNALDSVGTNHGVWLGASQYGSGEVGQAFNFNGASYVQVPDAPALHFSNVMTVEAWVNLRTFSGANSREIVSKIGGPNSDPGSYTFSIDPVSQKAYFIVSDGSSYAVVYSSSTILTNQWTHLAGTYDGSTVKIYVNGQFAGSTPWTQGIFADNHNPLVIGCTLQYPNPTSFFNGLIDEVSLYNRALSTNEIAAIYAAGSAGKCLPPTPVVISGPITNSANGHSYYLLGGSSWTEAEAKAVALGGHLATINDAAENAWVLSTFGAGGTRALWIGLNDAASEGTFTWVSGDGAAYRNWSSGEPNNYGGNENYAYMGYPAFTDGTWNDQPDSGYNPVSGADNRPYMFGVVEIAPAKPSPPAIFAFTPRSGTNGTVVTLVGTNFSPVAASNIVYFGAVRATVGFASPTNLLLQLPVGATFAPPTVTVGGLTGTAKNSFTPTFAGSGLISAVNFAPRVNLTSGNGPVGTAIADLDGDGKPDMVIADGISHTISVYRNISSSGTLTSGSFGPRVALPGVVGTTTPYLIVAADVDGDGRLDLVTTEVSANLVSVFRNLATPGSLSSNSFAPRVSFTVGNGPRALEVADLDGDGRPEIVSANYGSSTVSILRNVSSPGPISSNSFAPRLDLPAGSGTHGLALADLDGDGKLDIATANAAANTISLLRNLATPGSLTTASFAPAVALAGPTYPHFLRAADLDGDGKLELILTSYLGQSVSVYRNLATAGTLTVNSFAPRVEFALGARGHTVSIGDLNGDSKPDVIVDCEIPDRVCVFQNLGVPGSFTSGSFAARVDLPGGYNVWGSSVGDLDGDSRPDILVANDYDNNISIYRNLGSLPPTITQQPASQSVVLGDWVTFNVLATGTSPFSYQWRFNGDAIAGATNNSLVLPEAELSQAGNYSVTVANAAGSVLSSNATLAVTMPVCTTPPAGLAAWWQAESNTLDSVGVNHGLNFGSVSYTPSKVGSAFNFNGSNFISVADAPALNPTNAITVEAWIFRKAVVGTWDPVVKKSDNSQVNGYALEFNGNNLLFWIYNNGWRSSGGSVPIALGKWYHVAGVYDGTRLMCYTNGVLAASFLTSGNIKPAVNPLSIGNDPGNSTSRFFNGMIDEVSIYNRALSTNEIAAIYAARGAGKCPLPPTVLSVTPTNWYVNEGSTVSYTVAAVGSPALTYQWQHNGFDIPGATGSTLTLSNVVYAQAGNYAVVVSNPGGMITSSNVLLRVNRAPVADASATDTLAISPNGTNAVVVLDGSRSSDPDGDPLTYAWFNFGETNAFATSIVAMESLPVGTNQIILTVNDGMASGSQSIAIEVITTAQALDRLIALVQSGSGNTQPLVASLRAALAAIDRSQPAVAINQLESFINKVQVQLAPSDPVLAAQLIADAQAIIDALNGGTSVAVATVEITALTPDHHGKAHLKIKGINGRVHVVETSTNMVDWVPVGVASQSTDGSYEFDDSGAQDTGARFYRVISPK